MGGRLATSVSVRAESTMRREVLVVLEAPTPPAL